MEAEQPASAELNYFHKDNIPFKSLDDISRSISELYVSIKDSYPKFDQLHIARNLVRNPHQAVGKLIVRNNADTVKAENLVHCLRSEMERISESAEDIVDGGMVVDFSYNMWEDIERYSTKWAETLRIVERIFGAFRSKAEQMNMLWKRTEKCTLIEEMTEGTEEGTDLFHQILAKRLEKFGIDEVEDVLDEFVASKEDEAHEAERKRKESEGLKALDIAREGFKEVFDGLKEELEELKRESWEVREELSALKRGEGY
ncbi:hypothetical protein V500_08019 [Pseudogymnoascus sp. VKM F-4518 (FW-2643)]|nr:hypothetical protein V500_08019 [Pseudogymnoascus sp. VKM F-4518 (FW-2643)]